MDEPLVPRHEIMEDEGEQVGADENVDVDMDNCTAQEQEIAKLEKTVFGQQKAMESMFGMITELHNIMNLQVEQINLSDIFNYEVFHTDQDMHSRAVGDSSDDNDSDDDNTLEGYVVGSGSKSVYITSDGNVVDNGQNETLHDPIDVSSREHPIGDTSEPEQILFFQILTVQTKELTGRIISWKYVSEGDVCD
ncbi:hypothetical protein L1987_46451 [Smallanthus sonchifolius]|uniref:Uncharacterized protein n=1 Tax=Smallanthus sonchifolius TaxID=185202 RepID=A0ACB9FZ82_9ASTR|nr:hypothetical protein L1987_46451 [Smallanthus sonchifolius]